MEVPFEKSIYTQNIPSHHLPELYRCCYLTNNNFAYKYDSGINPESELKILNFVPTYDTWCLNCGNKNAQNRCSGCKSVYFCNRQCQKKCWPIHKKHCQRDLFSICSFCCKDSPGIKCDNCPVKFCDEKCKSKLYISHKEYDCDNFNRIFGK